MQRGWECRHVAERCWACQQHYDALHCRHLTQELLLMRACFCVWFGWWRWWRQHIFLDILGCMWVFRCLYGCEYVATYPTSHKTQNHSTKAKFLEKRARETLCTLIKIDQDDEAFASPCFPPLPGGVCTMCFAVWYCQLESASFGCRQSSPAAADDWSKKKGECSWCSCRLKPLLCCPAHNYSLSQNREILDCPTMQMNTI